MQTSIFLILCLVLWTLQIVVSWVSCGALVFWSFACPTAGWCGMYSYFLSVGLYELVF